MNLAVFLCIKLSIFVRKVFLFSELHQKCTVATYNLITVHIIDCLNVTDNQNAHIYNAV